MDRRRLCLVAAVLVACLGALGQQSLAAPATLYVSTEGNDAWSGTLPDPNATNSDGPFATLGHARDELRARKQADGLPLGATVYVRGGEYFLTESFTLNAPDSGTPNAHIRYMAYRGEKPILIGGRGITGFKPYKGKVMAADLRAIGLGGVAFEDLYFNGKRQELARFPNYDPDNPYAGGFSYVEEAMDPPSNTQFHYAEGTVHEWARPADGQVWIYPSVNYWNNIVPIAGIDREKRIITLAQETSFAINKGDRYYVRGLFEELDAPGEWYLDKANSILYFWPPSDVTKARVSVPVVDNVIQIAKADSDEVWPHDIDIVGFTIEGCKGAGVAISFARRCRVMRNTIRNAGNGVATGPGEQTLIFGNDVSNTGSSGIALWSGARDVSNPERNRVENNYIHHTGYYSKMSSAIDCWGVGNIISHNLIHDCPRIGMSFGGNDHVIEYNHCRHMNLETQDSGAIYACARDWTQRGTVIRYNYVHDTLGYGREGGNKWYCPFYTFGIYLDDWTSGIQVYGNIVARSFLAGIDVHSGRDNDIRNNIIYDCYHEQMRYQEWPTTHDMLPGMFDLIKKMNYPPGKYPGLDRMHDARADATMSYDTFERNIIEYGRPGSGIYAVSGLDYATAKHDYNVIWRFDGQPVDNGLEAMRQHGLDLHTLVADPMLVDPEHGDFRLRPDSPALKMGFEQIPVDKIGPYKHPMRASWPIVEAEGAREHPHKPAVANTTLPQFGVSRTTGPITIDGKLDPAEWGDLDRAKAMVLEQDPNRNKGVQPRSYAWLTYDDQALYVGLLNEVDAAKPLSLGDDWGRDDAAEVCLQDADAGESAPVFVLQGFANGHFQSTTHAGAPAEAAAKLGAAVRFAAARGDGFWSAEWRIPAAAAGTDPKTIRKLRFNIGVRKTGGPAEWVVWMGTGGPNFVVENAGEIVFVK